MQQQLASNRVNRTTRRNVTHPSLFAGRIFGPDGKSLTPTHSSKGKKRYRYYVSKDGALRLPAKELETAVKTAISNHRPLLLYCEQNTLSDEGAFNLIDRVQLVDGELNISVDPEADIPAFTIPYLKRKRGVEHKLVLDGSSRRDPDLALIKRTVRAMD
ncbi:MAG: hypothetical protein AAF296_03865 [Pseudomonadota bacterium]